MSNTYHFSALLNLSRLHILDLDHNDLTMLPAEISRMDSLETLLGKTKPEYSDKTV